MNWTTIAATAALLALQATILSLLHNSSAQAEVVHRCGQGDYRAQPCHQAGATSDKGLSFKDDRTQAQLAQALALRHQPGHTADAPSAGRRRSSKTGGSATVKAVALSQHRSGMAPFHDGRDLSDSVAGRKAAKADRRADNPHRTGRARPFVARSPKAGSQTGVAVSETAWR